MADSTRPSAPRLTVTPFPPLGDYPDPIPQILPFGSVNFFSGASGVGKTIVLADWCARLREGLPILGHATHPPTAFGVIAADRDWSTFDAAFTAAGFPDIPHYTLAEDPEMDPRLWRAQSAFQLLQTCLDKLAPPPGAFVLIDPIAPLFIAGDQNKARDVAVSTHWFRRVARQRLLTLVCCANVAKARQDEDFKRKRDRISGSGAFVAYSDTQIWLDVNEEDQIRTLGWSPRRHEVEEFRLAFHPERRLFVQVDEEHTQLKDEHEDPAKDRPTQLLLLISYDPIAFDVLASLAAEKLLISKATLKRDLAVLLDRGAIEKPRHGWYKRRKLA